MMMIRKSVWMGVVAVALFLFSPLLSGNGAPQEKGQYDDAKAVLGELAAALESFIENMEAAEGAEAIAECLDEFTASMSELVPGLNEIREKYPELKDESTHPEELKPLLQRVNKDFAGMMKAYGKVKENLSAAAVKESDDRYKEVMAKLK
jgi:uncharacterized coiled-coil DUF342 family protein